MRPHLFTKTGCNLYELCPVLDTLCLLWHVWSIHDITTFDKEFRNPKHDCGVSHYVSKKTPLWR
jgi:hypothetical protein